MRIKGLQKKISLKTKLFLFTVILSSLAIILTGITIYKATIEKLNTRIRMMEERELFFINSDITKFLKVTKGDAEILSDKIIDIFFFKYRYKSLNVKNIAGIKELRKYIYDIIKIKPYYKSIILFDRFGREILNSSRSKHSFEKDIQIKKLYTQITGPDVIKITRDIFHFQLAYSLFVPIFYKHKLFGGVIIEIYKSIFYDFLDRLELLPDSYSFILDNENNELIIYPYHQNEIFTFKNTVHRYKNIHFSEKKWFEINIDGSNRLIIQQRIPELNYRIGIDLSKKEVYGPAANVRKWILIMLLFTIIIIGLLTYFFTEFITIPLKKLLFFTKKLSLGKFDIEIEPRSLDEIGKLTKIFTDIKEKLQETEAELIRNEKMVAMGRMSAVIAHEIRNPLNTIRGAVEYLSETKFFSNKDLRFFDIIETQIKRIDLYITRLLYYSRMKKAIKKQFDFKKLIEEIAMNFSLAYSGIDIKINLTSDDNWIISADIDQIRHLLDNLIRNGAEAMHYMGQIDIILAYENQIYKIIIKDQGGGIPEEEQESIFEPFYTTKENGTGIGLSIVKEVLDNHNGKISIVKSDYNGTEIEIMLPEE